MAIDNVQAIKWSNEKCRPISNRIMELYVDLQVIDGEWIAQDVAQYFPVGGGTINDGAEDDGRPINDRDNVITMAGNIQSLITNIAAIKASFQKISNLPIE